MSDQQHEKVFKLLQSREKVESKIKRIHQQTIEAIEKGGRRVLVERFVESSKDARTKTIKNHDQLLKLTIKFDDSVFMLTEKETC